MTGQLFGKLRSFYISVRASNRSFAKALVLIVTCGLTYLTLVMPIASRPSFFSVKVGDVAPQDIQAPSALTYPSEVLTEQLRQEAEQRVSAVYLPADPGVARRQVELLRSTLNFINTVRFDSYATNDQKLTDLAALEDIQLNRELAEQILMLSDTRWQMTQQESLSVLEQVMRETIREDLLREAQRRVPTLISFSLPQDLADLVTSLVTPFIVPNSLYSAELTTVARQDARNKVQTAFRSFAAGEIIVRRGQIISQAHWEAMTEFGLIQRPNNYRFFLASFVQVSLLGILTALYFIHRKLGIVDSVNRLALIALTFLIFLYAARLVIPNRTVIPYVFPIPAFGLAIACLFHVELGMMLAFLLSVLAAYGLPNSLELTVYYIVSSFFGILILGRGQRIGSFVWAGIGIGAAGSAVVLTYRLTDSLTDLLGIGTLIGAAFFNGMASASLTLILQFVLAQILGLATAMQLLEISRPDHPLQQFILQNSPGSYQHSLQVAIMAEQASEKIGADSLLVRVGAIYHDVGKALNPSFFIENQIPGKLNPHDDLDPMVSAQTIIRHVTDGSQLARKYRMPPRIIDFIMEHHGTLMTRYQYSQALKNAGNDPEKVDINQFRYPGPRPQSKETALLMLADGCQARARAELPQNEEEMTNIVRKVFEFCQHEGQLDDTRLTLRDLNLITESFVKTLQNTYHPRIRYPEISPKGVPQAVLPSPGGDQALLESGEQPIEINPLDKELQEISKPVPARRSKS